MDKDSLFGVRFRNCNPNNLEVGKDVVIQHDAYIETLNSYSGQNLNPKLILEDGVHIGFHFTALVEDIITIKKDTLISNYCSLITNNHGMDAEGTLYGHQPLSTAPITIEEECWLGINVTVLCGVRIGKRSIIAAGSIVTKDIPPYSIAAGSPAKVIKRWDFDNHCWKSVK